MLNEDIKNTLSIALKKRNWLAHSYFVDHALDFINESGRHDMIKELNHTIELFNSVEDILQPITKSAALKYGLTDEVLEKIQKEMCESVKSDL
ncbi:hypothetical protein I5L29_13010 [Serratia marcescens]|nr:hypothetical protein [Serratia marcescens]